MNKEKYTGVSLFTGAGGMDVGFEKAGVKVVFVNEIIRLAQSTTSLSKASYWISSVMFTL